MDDDRRAGQMTHIWHWRCWLPERKGWPCRVVCTGTLNSALVEFADGHRVVTSRYAVRRAAMVVDSFDRQRLAEETAAQKPQGART